MMEKFLESIFSFILGLLKEPITMIAKRFRKSYTYKKNNILIFITGHTKNENALFAWLIKLFSTDFVFPFVSLKRSTAIDFVPFSINLKRSTSIDFASWTQKIESGGDIVIEFEYITKAKKIIKNKSIDEEKCKEIYEAIKGLEKKGEIMKLMIKKALLEREISSKICCFSDFVEATSNKCFRYIRNGSSSIKLEKDDWKILEAYNSTRSSNFKFEISSAEYANVLEKSKDAIEIPYYVSFNEFMDYVNDKSILETEIIPEYLIKHAIKELNQKTKIPIEDLNYWYISVG